MADPITLCPDFLSKWESIIRDVTASNDVPLKLVNTMVINTSENKRMIVHVKDLLSQGVKDQDLSEQILERIEDMGGNVVNVEYNIDVDAVAQSASVATQSLLENLK